MLLETIKTILDRLKGLKDLAFSSLPFPPASDELGSQTAAMDVDHEINDPTGQSTLSSSSFMNVDQTNDSPNTDQPSQFTVAQDDGASVFRFAHDFVISNSTIISQIINAGDIGFRIVGEKRMIGAEVDSSARKYSPRCHPETRKKLRNSVVNWIFAKRDFDLSTERPARQPPRMLWIMGPAGVGKSAVAQTIAEEAKADEFLGATLFFSRPNRLDDPEKIIPTLAYQLAVKHPQYKPILNQRLADDPSLLEKTLRVQFKELIVDPFSIIVAQDPQKRIKPLLIILDGLDECEGEEAQCELIEVIADHVRSVGFSPLLWMVCSRPEWHFRYLISRADFPATCRREQMSIDDPEARQDVAIFLREEFALIRRRFSDYLSYDWPPSYALQLIILKASGLFALASTIVRFVGDKTVYNPQGQLQLCLDCLNGLSERAGPFEMLDVLYREICSTVPPSIFATTKRILGALLLTSAYSDYQLLSKFSLSIVWKACSGVTDTDARGLLVALKSFDFRRLEQSELEEFPRFVSWFRSCDLLRTEPLIHLRIPSCPSDHSTKRHIVSLDQESARIYFPDLKLDETLYFHVGYGEYCSQFTIAAHLKVDGLPLDHPTPRPLEGLASSAVIDQLSSPKNAQMGWESPPSEELQQRKAMAEDTESKEDASDFLAQMSKLLKAAANDQQESELTALTEMLLKGVNQIPGAGVPEGNAGGLDAP
ncbi:hypothetical protein NP233_g5866 [Leucocoprinus birnbaumii]|uniref:NACHT domain-containing protein n=1 Tax=Leucocoprinus birnbaumii TaxID=56174 RepID=A0AAD5VUD2_9AGAR|nr:hypothetical protein NP233_g5866 [Leucocoprinus birnbaumii]